MGEIAKAPQRGLILRAHKAAKGTVLTRAASSQRRQLWQQRTVPERLVFLILLLPRFARLHEKESVKPTEVAGAQDLEASWPRSEICPR